MGVLRTIVPTVGRRWLYLAAGVLWGAAGAMLCARAYGWLASEDTAHALLHLTIGAVCGALIYRFKFSRVADKNIRRISRLAERAHPLAFQSPPTYLLIAFMMGLGIALRHSGLPRYLLAILYLGIGLGLVLASLRYYHYVQSPARSQVPASDSAGR